MSEITNRDRLFLLELLADPKLNPEKAALKAGYSEALPGQSRISG